MRKIGLIVILCAASIGLTAIQARASDWDERTVFTFTEPVQIFGRTLPAGTYTFKIVDTIGADRDIVQVLNVNETHSYGMFQARPTFRMNWTTQPVLTYEERRAGTPEAVKTWFYPFDNFGHEFVYRGENPKGTD